MPIYEYVCGSCKTEFELRLPFGEADKPTKCPKCKAGARKLISSFAFKTGSNLQAAEKAFRKSAAKK